MIHRRLLRLAGLVPAQLALIAAITTLASGLALAQALLLAEALRRVVVADGAGAVLPIAAGLGLAGLRAATLWAREIATARSGGVIRTRLRDALIGRLADLGPAWAERTPAGESAVAVVDGVEGLDAYLSRYLPQLLVVAVVPVAIAVGLLQVSGPAATALLVAVVGAVVLPRFWDARLLRLGSARWREYERLAGAYVEAAQALPTLRIFGADARTADALAQRSHSLYRTTMRQLRVSLVEPGVSALALHLGTGLAVLAAAVGVATGDAAPIAAFVFLMCARECFRPIAELAGHWHAGYQGLNAVEGIERLMSARPAVADSGTRAEPARGRTRLRLREVSFRYANGLGVDGVSFELSGGETLGLTGPSGAGKSTIAKLLERRFDPASGVIELDGSPMPDFTLDALRASILVVGQETYLFHGTVSENLRLARPEATDEELRHAVHLADAADFVDALPQGYDTVLDERAGRLSGGERQRLAIARGLVAARPVLVLDEATSALDAATEARVLDRIAAAGLETACLVIAHRASALARADRILRLDAGRMADPGPALDAARTLDGASR